MIVSDCFQTKTPRGSSQDRDTESHQRFLADSGRRRRSAAWLLVDKSSRWFPLKGPERWHTTSEIWSDNLSCPVIMV